MHELDEKLERMARLCSAHHLGGVLLTTQPNFAWITGGRSNRIDGSREPGNGAIFVTADGRRFLIANSIEMPRLRRHHQGGPIGYHARDWLAHPTSDARVRAKQAFAWNPSITGTKVEDTVLLVDGNVEIITGSPDWPALEFSVRGQTLKAPLVLER